MGIPLFSCHIGEGNGAASARPVDNGDRLGTKLFLFDDRLHHSGHDVAPPTDCGMADELDGFGEEFLGMRTAREKKQKSQSEGQYDDYSVSLHIFPSLLVRRSCQNPTTEDTEKRFIFRLPACAMSFAYLLQAKVFLRARVLLLLLRFEFFKSCKDFL
jgi:hypothetical protein